MATDLILLTKEYPYGTGEEFLETELPILSEKFDSITIVATAVPRNAKITRDISHNIKVYKITDTVNRYIRYIKYTFRGLAGIFDDDVMEEISFNKNIKSILGIMYIFGRSKHLYNKVKSISDVSSLLNHSENVLIYSYWFADLPYLALLMKRNSLNAKRIRIVSRAHGYDLYDFRNKSGRIPFRNTVFRDIDHVFPCSKDGTAYLVNKFPQFAKLISTSYLGTQDYGLSNSTSGCNHFRIVSCSVLVPLKRLHLLVESLSGLVNRGIDIEWVCIGDGPVLNELKEEVKQYGLENRTLFKGYLNNTEVLNYYKNTKVDLFVNVSETEGLPVSIMEAISFGIQVVATDVGGTREIVKNGITGTLIDKDISAETLEDAIIERLDNKIDPIVVRDFWKMNFDSSQNYKQFAESLLLLCINSVE